MSSNSLLQMFFYYREFLENIKLQVNIEEFGDNGLFKSPIVISNIYIEGATLSPTHSYRETRALQYFRYLTRNYDQYLTLIYS